MALEDVHVMEMDRATSRLEVTRINPTRQFLLKTENGMGLYTWQNGGWYDTGGNPILDTSLVPQKFRDEIEANPVTVVAHGPAVTWTCKYCGEQMNQSDMEPHIHTHMEKVMKGAGALEDPKGERQVTAKNTHRGT